ncbi:SctD/MshK family protein [Pseudomonas matsuisoli]|uniref:Type III secretion protein D n=1 Tax=Pseudomonas matsuisoli TaxID=1515666 RepID=A0A917PP84_9PSED|nr:FHA domain-containing protein [Pseudomonas matsuisoli]GGJ85726.1 hypothetical protein GCM10009304_09740 [Pseudomonas matsuisoli]
MAVSPQTAVAPLSLPRFVVLAGAHAGASLSLDQAEWKVGSSADCDVILSDSDIASQHFTLRFGKAQSVTVEATGADVRVDEVDVVKGSGYKGRLPMRIQAGAVVIALAAPDGVRRSLRFPALASWFNRNAAVAGGGVAGICLLLYPFIAMSDADASAPKAPPAVVTPVAASAALPQTEAPVSALKTRLGEAGLDHLRVDAQGSYLQVGGEVNVREMEQWRGVQRWFDETYGRTHLLHGTVRLREVAANPRVRFQAIWSGKNPYVIGERGQRLYPGAAVSDGWMLQRIEADRVILARDGQEFSLTL